MIVVFEQKNNPQKHKILCKDKIKHQKKLGFPVIINY